MQNKFSYFGRVQNIQFHIFTSLRLAYIIKYAYRERRHVIRMCRLKVRVKYAKLCRKRACGGENMKQPVNHFGDVPRRLLSDKYDLWGQKTCNQDTQVGRQSKKRPNLCRKRASGGQKCETACKSFWGCHKKLACDKYDLWGQMTCNQDTQVRSQSLKCLKLS